MNQPPPSCVTRPYRPADRAAVRQLCADTADRGEPVENFFSDRELVADLVTRYYTDFEPESCRVVECEGVIVGYLTGCLDTRRCRRFLLWRCGPPALARAIGRGLLFRRDPWRLARRLWRDGRRHRFAGRVLAERYPGHLHLNLASDARGHGLGQELFRWFAAYARAAGVRGLHVRVHPENRAGRAFFERQGFRLLNVLPTDAVRPSESVIYALDL